MSCSLLLLGGGLYDGDDLTMLNRLTSNKATSEDHQRYQVDTKRWTNDFNKFQKSLGDIQLFHQELPKLKPNKEKNASLIRDFFDSESDCYILYYGGHGDPDTGDWIFANDQKLSFTEVIDAWRDSIAFNKFLLLVCDSCHSGMWTSKLKKLCIKDETFENAKIAIQSGCLPEEESFVEYEEYFEDHRIGSMLLRKMIYDRELNPENKFEECFIWATDQHPNYYVSPAIDAKTRERVCSNTGERTIDLYVLGCPVRIFSIENSWKLSKGGTMAKLEKKGSKQKPFVRFGNFY